MPPTEQAPEITEAIRLHREGKQRESRDCLRDFLLRQPAHLDALLWLAKVSPEPQEAIAAAELALKLDPGNEVAQRAVIAVRERAEGSPQKAAAERAELSAAVALSTGMTLAQARAVKWPFRGINRPLGEALDDGTVSLRDLGWAIENVQESRIRDAARAVLLTRLMDVELQEPPTPLRVVAGSRFTERQERVNLVLATTLAGALFLLSMEVTAGSLYLIISGRRMSCQASLGLLGVLLLAALGTRAIYHLLDRTDQYRLGRQGEEKAVDVLRYALDGRWTLFRNLEWPNRRWGDVDLVLVGPGGLWAFEVKAYSGQNRNVGDRWERRGRFGWRRLTTHPGRQARRNAARLREYLHNHGVDVRWVEAAVAWAGEPGSLSVEDPATIVWPLGDIAVQAEELWQGQGLSEETVRRVVDVLERESGHDTASEPR